MSKILPDAGILAYSSSDTFETQIIVRLPDDVIGAPRDLSVKVQLRGPATDTAFIKIAGP